MDNGWKKIVGRAIWNLSDPAPVLRRLFSPLGMRTRKEWFAGRTASFHMPDGRAVKLLGIENNYMTFLLHWNDWRFYEPVTLLLLRDLVREKQALLYGGANIGYYALAAAASNANMKIFGFEPHPKLFDIFQNNVRANGFNVTCEKMAVSDTSGELTFFLAPSDMSGSLESDFRSEHVETVKVPTRTVDEYLSHHPELEKILIKLIVEGHEHKVLRGAPQTLAKPGTELIIAVVRDYAPSTVELLKSYGYRFYQLAADGFHPQESLTLCRQGDYAFLDYFVTRRTPDEVNRLYANLRPEIQPLDLQKSSYYRPDWDKPAAT